MLSSMFDSSTLPLLEQVVNFTQARHGVLAGNIANLDTPGYRTRDLSVEGFQERLKSAIAARDQAASLPPGYGSPGQAANSPLSRATHNNMQATWDEVRESAKDILYHDDSDVSIEQQITEVSKNQMQHNLALTIMNSQFRLLRTAISERL